MMDARRHVPAGEHGAAGDTGQSHQSHEEYELRVVNELPQLVKVEEGFVIPGRKTEIGEAGFESFKERVVHMLQVLQASSGVIIAGVRYVDQDPRPPFARVIVRMPEYYLPKP